MRSGTAIAAATLVGAVMLAPGASDTEDFEIRGKVERVHLDDVFPAPDGPQGRRIVELYVRALTRHGDPVESLQPVDLVIRDGVQGDEPERIGTADVELLPLSETGRGLTAVVAMDTSRTMKGEPFERAKAAALEFLDKIGPRDRVAIVAFSDEVRVVAPFSASRAEVRVEAERLRVDERSLRTVLYDGVHKAMDLIRQGHDVPRRAFVIVFSDGKDGGSQRSLGQVIEYSLGNEVRPPVLVFSIGYARFGNEGLEVLRQLSRKTGAESLEATSTRQLRVFFNDIWHEMMRSYVVRYPGDLDGELHTVEIAIEGQIDSRTVRYPKLRSPLWPYLAVVAAVLLLALAALALARGRSAGRLVFLGGPRAGEGIALARGKTTIGALPENDLVIVSPTVSRYHAAIRRRGRRIEIEDLNSSNGTFVNGSPVRTSPLRPGDKIRIADVDLVYER